MSTRYILANVRISQQLSPLGHWRQYSNFLSAFCAERIRDAAVRHRLPQQGCSQRTLSLTQPSPGNPCEGKNARQLARMIGRAGAQNSGGHARSEYFRVLKTLKSGGHDSTTAGEFDILAPRREPRHALGFNTARYPRPKAPAPAYPYKLIPPGACPYF